ncbi:ubiquitin-hydrolase Zn-finger-containing protein [Rathayibacter sp. PhB185]|nr:ubiquitin-hydrolase Zn-finger-containing protein [Rathayibacter sp. PhB186]ROS51824.1 ubiquitin-hydrolase Zn-finger-containing protein [Rathayibacter sp. PhB185]
MPDGAEGQAERMTTQQTIDPSVPPSGRGCVECEQSGSWWLHLRRCALCGHIGCCDDSLNRHATAHFHETGHSVIRSFEPGEEWFWDYRTDDYADGPRLADPQSHPADQSTPGPADRVPRDWQSVLTDRD